MADNKGGIKPKGLIPPFYFPNIISILTGFVLISVKSKAIYVDSPTILSSKFISCEFTSNFEHFLPFGIRMCDFIFFAGE